MTSVSWHCPLDQVAEAGRIVDEFLWRAAPDKAVIAAFFGIRGFLVKRADPEDFEHEMVAWAKKLRAWPGDVVLGAIDGWPDQSKFWPTWTEFKDAMGPAMSARYALNAAIRKAANPRLRAPDKEDLTEEQRAAVVQRYRELMAKVRLQEMEKEPEDAL